MRAQTGPQSLVAANLSGGNGSREALGTTPSKHQLQNDVCWALRSGRVSTGREEGVETRVGWDTMGYTGWSRAGRMAIAQIPLGILGCFLKSE